jgi:hypothetical protein
MGDWNAELSQIPPAWLKQVGGKIIATKDPTCQSKVAGNQVTEKVFDYFVVHQSWAGDTKAIHSDALTFSPHTGVGICCPHRLPNPLIEAERCPWKFPRALPLGPGDDPQKVTAGANLQAGTSLHSPDDLE